MPFASTPAAHRTEAHVEPFCKGHEILFSQPMAKI